MKIIIIGMLITAGLMLMEDVCDKAFNKILDNMENKRREKLMNKIEWFID